MNNICLETVNKSNICINNIFKNIDTAVSNYTPKETEQNYKTLTFNGVLTDIANCTFNKPSQAVDIYATIDNTPMCIGTLTSNGTVSLGCLDKNIVCTETYQWNRTMSRVVTSNQCCTKTNNDCLSYVAVKCPTNYNGSLDYYYYLDGCLCGNDIRGCPIYNSNCLVHKCFKSGCISENGCCIETCIYQTFITEQYWNIYKDSYNGQWGWKRRDSIDQCYLGYYYGALTYCDEPGMQAYPQAYKYDEECERHIDTDYKFDELCTSYCCLKCYRGPYNCDVKYPYRTYCEDVFLTQSNNYATISHGKCFCRFLTCDCYDLLDLNQWCCIGESDDGVKCYTRCFSSTSCLGCLCVFKPSFEKDNYINKCDIKRWDRKGCWDDNLDPDYIINGNPNTVYFTPVESINITGCEIDKTPSYDEKCYSNWLNNLKSINTLFSTEYTKEICWMSNSCCVKVADGTLFGNQRATVQYCVVQTVYQPTVYISSCCVCIEEKYL